MFEYSESSYSRFSRSQGRIIGSAAPYGVAYPSPFFDVAHTYMPDTLRQMYRWCRYYYLTNPIIAAVVNKMAEYPVTDIIVETENDGLKAHWDEFLEDTIKLRSFLIDIGLYYQCYGNAIISIHYPFVKYLTCSMCGKSFPAKALQYRFQSYDFVMHCPECGSNSKAVAKDIYIKSPRQLRMILWNPEDIVTVHNPITGEDEYLYEVPRALRNDIELGKPHIIQNLPQLVIDAVRKGRLIRLNPDNVYHIRRPSLLVGGKDSGMGVPTLLPVLKDTFYLQILKKANEAIAMERVYPLSIVFPQAASQTSDPFSTINLTKWRDQIQMEIARWRVDRAYIPILPLPVGHQVIGGDGRSLLLTQEVQMWTDQIVAGMGVPREFIFGGLQWSGSNVSLRMLENHFLRYISDLRRFVRNFVIKNVAAYLEWPTVEARFKPFKMADDLQRKALIFQYNTAGKVSDSTLITDADLDPRKEEELMEKETSRRMQAIKKQQLAQTEIQGEAQVVMAKFQARAQAVVQQEMMQAQQGRQESAPGEALEGMIAGGLPMGKPGEQSTPAPAPPIPEVVQQIAQQVGAMPPQFQNMTLQQIAQQNPPLAEAVGKALTSRGGSDSGSAGKPLPEKLPPRRDAASAAI